MNNRFIRLTGSRRYKRLFVIVTEGMSQSESISIYSMTERLYISSAYATKAIFPQRKH
jgi:hypothetical protein